MCTKSSDVKLVISSVPQVRDPLTQNEALLTSNVCDAERDMCAPLVNPISIEEAEKDALVIDALVIDAFVIIAFDSVVSPVTSSVPLSDAFDSVVSPATSSVPLMTHSTVLCPPRHRVSH